MNIIANNMVVLGILLLASVPTAMAQSRTDNSNLNSAEYRAGQLWTTGQGITVTVLAIEDVHRVGKVVHVRIDKISISELRGHSSDPRNRTHRLNRENDAKERACLVKGQQRSA